MSFIIEDGSGIAQANTYNSVAFVLAYLTERNRQDENGWADLALAVQQAHIIGATDYLENRFRNRFKGRKEFKNIKLAAGLLTFTTNPLITTTVVIGSVTYTFQSTLTLANDVLVGINTSATIDNLVNAILATPSEAGVTHGVGTIEHPDATARTYEDDTMICTARLEGLQGNLIVTTTTVAGASWSAGTLIGGTDTGKPQPLSFPRFNLFDRDGIAVCGIPLRLQQAVSEYAIRSAGDVLQPDPEVTLGGQIIEKTEKVDVILESTKYAEGGAFIITKPYPAADRLLSEYLQPTGLVFRS